ncbi:hypothetical protein QYF61_005533 [Mycteria americana]|uniref:RING-type E3 ubiquitin transferase n=1 Tax=Mycteria americana TaxID=33587 RepID=A0AAN7RRG2_MYCAM|nr:hypothetical protein QYF61_005533 [Mycteria americana]
MVFNLAGQAREMLCTAVVMAGSLALTTAVVAHAYYLKHQFYPTVVYLTKSSPSMAVLYIQAFVLVFLLGKFMGKVFFGQLRAAEMEHLLERSWYAVTETCLAFTVFRDDFSPRFVALFTLLLFLKCFHWLAEDRVDFMERSPNISWLFHFRIVSLMFLLGILDFLFVNHAYHSILTRGASVQLVFGFEYAILMTMVLTIFIKYVLHSIDLQNENPWDSKAVYMLYTELFTVTPNQEELADAPQGHTTIQRDLFQLEKWSKKNLMRFNKGMGQSKREWDMLDNVQQKATKMMKGLESLKELGLVAQRGGSIPIFGDTRKPLGHSLGQAALGFIKVLLYMAFMTIMIKVHTFPLFAIRPMYLAMRQFKKAVTDAIMSRRAIRNMNTLYPDATPEELQAMDNVCIICREEMVTGAKRLPCNHIFHTSCLRSWFQRQQTCPTCRMDVLRASLPAQPPPEPPEQAPPPPQTPQVPQPPNCESPLRPSITPAWWDGCHQLPVTLHRTSSALPGSLTMALEEQTAGEEGWEVKSPWVVAKFGRLGLSPPSFPSAVPQGILPPFPPGMFPFWPPVGPFPPVPGVQPPNSTENAAPSSGATSAARPGDTANAGSESAATGAMPGLPFPPPWMGMPWPPLFGFPPMPMPPAGFAGLTEEELRAMEGHDRQNLEARLQCLQNIHTLLDAAMVQINQYLTVLATIGSPRPATPRPPSTREAPAEEPTPLRSPSSPSAPATTATAGSAAAADPTTPVGAEGFTAKEEEEEEDSGEGPSLLDEPDTAELRRRRLQKLASPPAASH